MAFSIAGHLHAHFAEAVALLSALTEMPIARLVRLAADTESVASYALDGIDAEWFPPRSAHTGDMSGCDIAACLELTDGRRVLLTVEVKYTDTFSAKPVAWDRYEEHLTALGLDEVKTAALVEAGCSQVLRQVMVSDSTRRRGLAPGAGPTVTSTQRSQWCWRGKTTRRRARSPRRSTSPWVTSCRSDSGPIDASSTKPPKSRGYRSGRATWLSATSETDLARLRRRGRASALPHRIRLFRPTDTWRKDAVRTTQPEGGSRIRLGTKL